MKNAQRSAADINDVPSGLNSDTIQQKTSPGLMIDRLLDEPLLLDSGAAQRIGRGRQSVARSDFTRNRIGATSLICVTRECLLHDPLPAAGIMFRQRALDGTARLA